MPAPVLMTHGAFCGGWCFERFRRPFEAAGHRVSTPDLPGHGERRGEGVRGWSLRGYARELAAQVRACPEPPLLVGHSMGGLVSAMAAAEVPIAGLIMLAPSPPWGVLGSAMEVAASLRFGAEGAWNREIPADHAVMSAVTLNTTPRREHARIHSRMGPESGRALYEIINWWADPLLGSMVPPGAIRAPALAVAGEIDQVHPPSTVGQVALRTGAQMRIMDGMSHWLIGEPGWEAVADVCLEWWSVAARAAA